MRGRREEALATAVLFATHPIHTDAVAPTPPPPTTDASPLTATPSALRPPGFVRRWRRWCREAVTPPPLLLPLPVALLYSLSLPRAGEMLSAACFLLSLLAYARAARADPARAASVLASLLWCSAPPPPFCSPYHTPLL